MKLYLLGTPLVTIDDRPIAIKRRRAQALLYVLAETGERKRRESLAAMLWPESDQRRAHGSLRRHLSELNRLLGGGWVDADSETVGLRSANDFWLDVTAFRQIASECRKLQFDGTDRCAYIELLKQAADLYRDDYLAGFTLPDCPDFDEWQFFRTEELRQVLHSVLEQLIHALEERGEEEAAIPYALRWLSLDILHEPAHRKLMTLYAACGRKSAALRQYHNCERLLQDELGVVPSAETTALYESIRRGGAEPAGQDAASSNPPRRSPGHILPTETTPFVGRERELADLTELCANPNIRLITILGTGGMGKTRLALEVAQGRRDSYAHGVYFISLASTQTEAQLVSAIAEAVDFQFQPDERPPKQQLLGFLQRRQMLLVLDNFEHLIDRAGLVNEFLLFAPDLEVLVTSRERLQLTGETVFALGNMNFPVTEGPYKAADYSAVLLFIQTARRVRSEFDTEPDYLEHVARICRLVGGMPLGILLAATWVELLSTAEIAEELTHGLNLLETHLRDLPERQRSMRAVFAYSWNRLSEAERDVFMRLSVLRGGFARRAASGVAGATLPILIQLANRSFVQRRSEDRYENHELLRQYGSEQLAASGHLDTTLRNHATYFLDFVYQREAELAGYQQLEAITELEADLENIRAAWCWAVQNREYDAVNDALEGLFRWFWMLHRGRQHQGLDLLRYAREQWTASSAHIPPMIRARILARTLEYQAPWLVNSIDARKRIEEALEVARKCNDVQEIAFCLWALGLAIVSERRDFLSRLRNMGGRQDRRGEAEDAQNAAVAYLESLTLFRQLNNQFYVAQVLENLGQYYRFLQDLDQAIPLLQESLMIRREQGDRFGMARSLRELGWANYVAGFGRETKEAWQEALEIRRSLDDRQGILDSLFTLSLLAVSRGDWKSARRLAGQQMEIASEINNLFYPRWTARLLEIASSMESATQRFPTNRASQTGRLTAFQAMLMHSLWSNTPINVRENLRSSVNLAAGDGEIAICLCVAANLLATHGDAEKATKFLALAFRYPQVAQSWVGLLPEIVDLPQKLRESLAPGVFEARWSQGQTLDISAAASELADLLAA